MRHFRTRSLATAAAAAIFAMTIGYGMPSAVADGPTTFSNTTAITIPAAGSPNQIGVASPYPSSVTVAGMAGQVSTVTATFNGFTHSAANDVDAMLVSPSGENLVVMSDPGDPASLTFAANANLTFSDAAASGLPSSGAIATGTYKPTNVGGGDAFPAPAPTPSSETTFAGAFTGIAANGTWSLYIVDDATGDTGAVSGGWSLTITTTAVAAATTTTLSAAPNPATTGNVVTFTATVTSGAIPVTAGTVTFTEGVTTLASGVALNGAGQATFSTSAFAEGSHTVTATYNGTAEFLTSNGSVVEVLDNPTTVSGSTFCNTGAITIPSAGSATPYPSHVTVAGIGTPAKVTAQLKGLAHAVPVDIDVLLVGPGGQNLELMSDVGGTAAVSGVDVTFDDAAASGVPAPLTSGTYKPTNDSTAGPDSFPAPAPAPSAATALSTFAGVPAAGQWSLYVVDDANGDSGSIANGWCLTFTTNTAPTITVPSDIAAQESSPGSGTASVSWSTSATGVPSPTITCSDGTNTITSPHAFPIGTTTVTCTATNGVPPDATGTFDVTVTAAPKIDSTTTLTSDPNPSTAGSAVTFTATVASAGGPVTSGSVDFSDGATVLGSVALDGSGQATFTTSALSSGTHSITADYAGTATFNPSSATVSQQVNPVAVANGPYTVAEGASLALSAAGSSTGAAVGYTWDVNGDGTFGDATGINPTLTWTQLEALGINDGPHSYTLALRVTENGATSPATVPLTVTNTAPTCTVDGSHNAVVGRPLTVKVGADDPSSADMAASFTYRIDWGDGSPAVTVTGPADPPVTHTYRSAGSFTATFSAADKDGASSGVGSAAGTSLVVVVAPAGNGGGLAATGATVAGSAGLGLLSVVAGTLLVMIGMARRRAA